ncbi:MAG: helix-hairpin-helix domain-containing protein [Erysipelotrichaceae bacterium]|nr:helix-hairpin-helix domain-containing protein [Erysipelotrichaceae bacterium]
MQIYNQVKLFLYNHKRKIIVIASLILLSLTITLVLLTRHNYQKDITTYENVVSEKNNSNIKEVDDKKEVEEKIYYYIDIKGYVNNPGVYSLEKGKRVVDAINIAGGLKKDANTSLLNLSKEISDQMVIVIYSNSEIKEYEKLTETKKQEEKICNDKIINDACISNSNNTNNATNNNANDTPKNNTTDTKPDDSNKTLKININTATKEELMTLKNVGESKALAIIEYRNKNGLFKTIDDLKNVSGIGDKLFESLKENITV